MPSLSPSPGKRPSMSERTASNHSLSNTPKQGHKVHRPRAHGRNLSHGKNLGKLGKIHSTANIVAEAARAHNRKKSGQESSPTSPLPPGVKRNSSHVALPKNTSHPNLRKNLSATGLPRNTSHGALKKLGLPPPQPKKKSKTTNEVGFELGDTSEEDEEDAEWEDSTISPEVTRANSKASTPARVATPNQELKTADYRFPHKEKTSSPPAVSLKTNNRSAPNFKSSELGQQIVHNPAILQPNSRSSRAPPAMSTMVAHAKPGQIPRNNSSRSFTHVDHDDVDTGLNHIDGSSSADGGVSHFLSMSVPANESPDYDSAANFMSNYQPQPSESPEKSKTLNKTLPSRTQQRLELQRREMMRSGAMTPTAPASPGMSYGAFGSSAGLHSRASSRGRGRTLAEDAKDMAKKYDMANAQLEVVQRFQNPALDSLKRLKAAGLLPSDVGIVAPGVATKSRPQSRRGMNTPGAANVSTKSTGSSPEERKPSSLTSSRPPSRGGGASNRVQFQRQGSHDDIGLSRSRGSDGDHDVPDGVTEEEALIRRIWESRDVYEAGEGIAVR